MHEDEWVAKEYIHSECMSMWWFTFKRSADCKLALKYYGLKHRYFFISRTWQLPSVHIYEAEGRMSAIHEGPLLLIEMH